MKKKSFTNLILLTFMLAFALLFTGCARQASGYAYQEATGYDVSKTVVSGMAGGSDEELEGLFTPVKSNLELDINNKFADNSGSEDELDFKEDENADESNEAESEEAEAGEEGNAAEDEQSQEEQDGENETEPQAPVDQDGENETEPQAPVDQLDENESQEKAEPDNAVDDQSGQDNSQPDSGNGLVEIEIPGSEEIITFPSWGGNGSQGVEYVPSQEIIDNGGDPDDYDTIVVPGNPGNGSENESTNHGQTEQTENTQETQPETPETTEPETESEDPNAADGEVYTAVPEIQVIENIDGGVYIQWTKVKGATEYIIKEYSSGYWIQRESTSGNSIVLSVNSFYLTEGKEYRYTIVPVVNGKEESYNQSGVKNKYIGVPVVTSVTSSASSITIGWAPSGYSSSDLRYNIYRNDGSGWNCIKTGAWDRYYTDSSVSQGVVYRYAVQLSQNSYTSAYDQAGTVGVAFGDYTATATNVVGGIFVSWNPVAGAESYIVQTSNHGMYQWRTMGSTQSTSYFDGGYHFTDGNTWYDYRILAVNNNCTSLTGAQCTVKYIDVPEVYDGYEVSNGIQIKWSGAPEDTDRFEIYRSDGGAWSLVGTTYGHYQNYGFVDETAQAGKTYTYSVKLYLKVGGSGSGIDIGSVTVSMAAQEPEEEPETDPPTTEPETQPDDNDEETEETTES